MSQILQELKRRKVVRVASVYAVVAWLLIQVTNNIVPALQLPVWTSTLIVVLLLIGFIPTLIAAWAYELTPDGLRPDAQVTPVTGLQATSAQPINYVILLVVLLVAGVQLAERFGSEQVAPAANPTAMVSGTQRLSIVLPERQPIFINAFPSNSLALSPDGRTLVYAAQNRDLPADRGTRQQLFQRSLDARTISALPETLGATQPFFSPDGQEVGFFTRAGELKKIALAGGMPVTLVGGLPGGSWSFGAWSDQDDIVYSDNFNLHRVPAGGGTPEQLTTLNEANEELGHWFPSLVPGDRAVLFTVDSEPPIDRRIEALMLDSGERRVVLDNASGAHVLASGHVLFQRDANVMLAPFDFDTLTVTGAAVVVPEAIGMDTLTRSYSQAQLVVAGNGSLAYLPEVASTRELGTLASGGNFEPFELAADYYQQPRVAPDGSTLSFLLQRDRESVLYTYDLGRGTTARLSQDSNAVEAAAWHPDGNGVAVATSDGISMLENGRQTLLVAPEPGYQKHNMRWTPDGQQLVYTRQQGQNHDIWVHDIDGAQPDRPIVATPAREEGPALSPDGRWLAFSGHESGRAEIYVQAWPEGRRSTVSREGGTASVWSADGSALFFVGSHDDVLKMLRVAVTVGPSGLQLGNPEPLFDIRYTAPDGTDYFYVWNNNRRGAGYDILPDGRFVLLRQAQADIREVVIVQNWFDEVRRLAPVAVPVPTQ